MDRFKNKIQVTKAFLPPMNEYINEIKKIWETNWLTNNGPISIELQNKLQKYLKIKNASLFVNGHCAMEVALKALNLKGEVITTPFTFASTTHAIINNNLRPVFCDIKIKDFTIDENKIEELITDKTSAIIPVHVFGYPCNIKKIEEIAQKYNLKVIYDAAHVFGVEIDGQGIGNFGDISMFSFHATKIFNTIEGGLLATDNEYLRDRFRQIRNFGIIDEEHVGCPGINAKMNEFQAAMGIVNLKYVDYEIEKRKRLTFKYREKLRRINGIRFTEEDQNVKYNYSYFPVIIDEEVLGISRNEIYDKLKKFNIFTRKYFYPLTTDFTAYKEEEYNNLVNARYISDRILALPMYGQLREEDIDYIVDSIEKIIEE